MEIKIQQPQTEMNQVKDLIEKNFGKKITCLIECDMRSGNITFIKTENKHLLAMLKTLKII